jgi:amino acid transporter
VAGDLKSEIKEFVSTRVAMLRAEMGEKLSSAKKSLPAMLLGGVLLGTAWLLLTGVLVTAIATAFSGPWAYTISLLIVGIAYLLLGGMVAMMGWRQITQTGFKPERTIGVLKQDEVWLATEAKTQL